MTALILPFVPRPRVPLGIPLGHRSIIPPLYYQLKWWKQATEMTLRMQLMAFTAAEYMVLASLGQGPEVLDTIRTETGALDIPGGKRLVARTDNA